MTETSPRCSIIIPTHQRRERVIRTLRTIQAQTYPNLEIVVSVDGSTDGTCEAIESLNDDRILIVRSDRPTGVANARNRGFEDSTGHYVGFCDDDDFWSPGKVAGQIEAMQQTGNAWSYSFVVKIDDRFNYLRQQISTPGDDFFERLLYSNTVPGGCSSVVCERSIFKQAGRFDPAFSMFADWDTWIRLAEISPPAVWEQVGTLYVFHPGQMSLDMSKIGPEWKAFRQKYADQRSRYPARTVEPIDRWIAQQLWKSGKKIESIRYRFGCESPVDLPALTRSVFQVAKNRIKAKQPEVDLECETVIANIEKIANRPYNLAAEPFSNTATSSHLT